jgi:thiol-disulfide isomerase/thioredoxin
MSSPSRRSSIRRFAAVLVVTSLVVAACAGSGSTEPQTLQAPVSTLDGDPVDLADFVGGPLVVNFFAESCPPCVAEMPTFEAIANEVAPEITFIGVSEDPSSVGARRIIGETGITYPVVWDRDGSALISFEALGMPTTLFVDSNGDILELHTGALSADDLRGLLAEHFSLTPA